MKTKTKSIYHSLAEMANAAHNGRKAETPSPSWAAELAERAAAWTGTTRGTGHWLPIAR